MTIYKMIIHIFSTYWKELIIYFLIFLGFVFVAIGQPEAGENQEFSSVTLDIAVVNHSDDQLSEHLVDYLSASHEVEMLSDVTIEDVENEVFSGTYQGMLYIPQDFEELVINGQAGQVELLLNERDMSSAQLNTEVDNYLRLANARVASGVSDTSELTNQLDSTLNETAEVEMVGGLDNQNILLAYTTGIALVGYFVLQIILGTVGMAMSEIKSDKIQDRINLSGISNLKYNTQVVLGQITYGGLILLVTISVLWFYIPSSIPIDYVRVIISLTLFILTALSMAFLMTSITNNRNIINGLTTVISLGLAFLSGLFIPYEIMGTAIQRIAHFSPLFYFRQSVMKDINSYSDLLTEWGLLLAFAVVFTLLGVAISQQKRAGKR
ncbi:ABC transporter permease [Ruoffia sp. FAM 26255]|uniref:ABC transporter permease n=1 Tax=Ruoffia sp. FAM 26255 TaxID=3259519 RepID=UPI003889223A